MEPQFDIEDGIPAAVAETTAALRSGAKAAFLSRLLFTLCVEVVYEYYITFNFFALLLRGLQLVRNLPQFFEVFRASC